MKSDYPFLRFIFLGGFRFEIFFSQSSSILKINFNSFESWRISNLQLKGQLETDYGRFDPNKIEWRSGKINKILEWDSPGFPNGSGAVERSRGRSGLLCTIRRVVNGFGVFFVADGCRQRHSIFIWHLQLKESIWNGFGSFENCHWLLANKSSGRQPSETFSKILLFSVVWHLEIIESCERRKKKVGEEGKIFKNLRGQFTPENLF